MQWFILCVCETNLCYKNIKIVFRLKLNAKKLLWKPMLVKLVMHMEAVKSLTEKNQMKPNSHRIFFYGRPKIQWIMIVILFCATLFCLVLFSYLFTLFSLFVGQQWWGWRRIWIHRWSDKWWNSKPALKIFSFHYIPMQ